ncbi:unnamed protein product [Vitrella brassicaformis CCMP3155]|uniref:Dynein light chain Tctex-type 1 n=1 Tax=Vitrella brassicaformis (strain CCMP3155) TaxID=1169540 RepID=A0A0G4EP08_VITBC|nr:unnamed protein product [Vitrella brassicaformis CCMP3155]|mmetsp:Transcript_21111/g.51493  ORF Transcript_21111/g.51493 Transcript_21111/m.51493 type:complete len:111 (-) Transcript_21111:741-1073(-)|eukprot:CEL98538.1 unnamed protein product [Vitrella brassicaformis CCMP3155]
MDDEGENEFVTEQVQEIAKHAINSTLTNVTYTREKVNQWCQQIIDSCLKELSKLDKPFKYCVTCIIMQKNGAPLHTAATAFWDTKTDGLCCMQVGNDTMDCIVTIYAMQI